MSESTTLYKVLGPDGRSIHGGKLTWSLPRQMPDGSWIPGEWHEATGALELCRNGLHLTDERGVWRNWIKVGAVAWEAEARGDRVGTLTDYTERKIAVRECRLLRPMPQPDWWVATERFIRDDIPAVPWLQPDGNPDPSWRVFRADSWAAARDAAWAAARDAAWAAARDAAWDAAWAAARDAAGDAAGDAARDAARAAAAYALIHYACRDLSISRQHRDHAAARWNVWQKGYALLCDVDGVLYVYAGPPRPTPVSP
jgi:hypothetical protein